MSIKKIIPEITELRNMVQFGVACSEGGTNYMFAG